LRYRYILKVVGIIRNCERFSMLNLFKRKNPYEGAARILYAQALEQTRDPEFYSKFGVPDSFDGRFDLLLLHIFLLMERMLGEPNVGQSFNQALFDVTFADMDQTLREMGIGDMGIPKHMRRMMKAFNGRMHAYSEAAEPEAFKEVLAKNLYGTVQEPDAAHITAMLAYVQSVRRVLGAKQATDILENGVKFYE
jgi:cytochrome b pre-mRNA-processing protein 3